MKSLVKLIAVFGILAVVSCGKEDRDVCLEANPPVDICCADEPSLSYCQPLEDMSEDADLSDMDPPICAETCAGETPVCDGATGQCVECVATSDCDSGVCDTASNTCVGCVGTPDCDSGVCDTASKTCVNCLEDTDCTSGVCKGGASAAENVCVACVSTTDCTTASASVCGADNTCGGCETAADCGHIAGTTQCVAGACVGCTPDTQAADCDGKVCAPSTLTCTNVALASVLALSTCQYDAQCQAGHTCVALNYAGNAHGSYCMPLFTGTPCGRPYGRGQVTRMSVDGADVTVCMIKEDLTTPEAIAAYETPCTEATAATDCPADGARCEVYDPLAPPPVTRVCTYTCSGPNDCKPGSACVGTIGSEYCGAAP